MGELSSYLYEWSCSPENDEQCSGFNDNLENLNDQLRQIIEILKYSGTGSFLSELFCGNGNSITDPTFAP